MQCCLCNQEKDPCLSGEFMGYNVDYKETRKVEYGHYTTVSSCTLKEEIPLKMAVCLDCLKKSLKKSFVTQCVSCIVSVVLFLALFFFIFFLYSSEQAAFAHSYLRQYHYDYLLPGVVTLAAVAFITLLCVVFRKRYQSKLKKYANPESTKRSVESQSGIICRYVNLKKVIYKSGVPLFLPIKYYFDIKNKRGVAALLGKTVPMRCPIDE